MKKYFLDYGWAGSCIVEAISEEQALQIAKEHINLHVNCSIEELLFTENAGVVAYSSGDR